MAVLKNAKWERVAQLYFADPERVGWKAYKAVYPKSSKRAAETGFSRLLTNAEFSARVAELGEAVARAVVEKKVMDLTEVLEELSKLGRASLKNCLIAGETTGDVIASLRDMPDEHAATIKTLTVDYYTEAGEDAQEPQGHGGTLRRGRGREVKRVKIELHDKRGALAELRRHYEPQKHADPDGRPVGTGAAEAAAETFTPIELARRVAFLLAKGKREAEKAKSKER